MTNHLQNQPRRTVDLRIPALEKYAYCLCLHVKTTTIFIAVFKLIRALLWASILLNTEFSIDSPNDTFFMDDRQRSTTIAFSILQKIIVASVSALGIYAVISGRAALLMPLYAILLVDFFFELPSFYNKNIEATIPDGVPDFRNNPGTNRPNGPSTYVHFPTSLILTLCTILKIYALCVVWKCYRYLRLIELVSPVRLAEIYPHIHQGGPQYPTVRVIGRSDTIDSTNSHNLAPPPYESIASGMKPPNYEEAMKSSNFRVNPSATNANPQQQQTIVFTNPTAEQHLNVTTQVISNSDINVRSSPTDIADEINSSTETIQANNVDGTRTTSATVQLSANPTNNAESKTETSSNGGAIGSNISATQDLEKGADR